MALKLALDGILPLNPLSWYGTKTAPEWKRREAMIDQEHDELDQLATNTENRLGQPQTMLASACTWEAYERSMDLFSTRMRAARSKPKKPWLIARRNRTLRRKMDEERWNEHMWGPDDFGAYDRDHAGGSIEDAKWANECMEMFLEDNPNQDFQPEVNPWQHDIAWFEFKYRNPDTNMVDWDRYNADQEEYAGRIDTFGHVTPLDWYDEIDWMEEARAEDLELYNNGFYDPPSFSDSYEEALYASDSDMDLMWEHYFGNVLEERRRMEMLYDMQDRLSRESGEARFQRSREFARRSRGRTDNSRRKHTKKDLRRMAHVA